MYVGLKNDIRMEELHQLNTTTPDQIDNKLGMGNLLD
jgi:hypothetical protein